MAFHVSVCGNKSRRVFEEGGAESGEALAQRKALDEPVEQQNDLIEFLKSLQMLMGTARCFTSRNKFSRPF